MQMPTFTKIQTIHAALRPLRLFNQT